MFKIFAMPLLAITIITWNTTAWGIISGDQAGTDDCYPYNTLGSNTLVSNGGANCSASEYMCKDGQCIESCTACSGAGELKDGFLHYDFSCAYKTCSSGGTSCTASCSTIWSDTNVTGYIYRTCKTADCSPYNEYDCADDYEGDAVCSSIYSCSGCRAKTQSCSAGHYLLGNSCVACPAGTYNPNTGSTSASACVACPDGYKNGGAGTASQGACVGAFTKTGSQTACSQPANAASYICGTCSPKTCKYYKNYADTITQDCTPANCQKPVDSVSCKANYYKSDKTCPACPSAYPYSDEGTTSDAYCYALKTNTGSQVSCSLGSANVLSYDCEECTPKTCDWRDYKSATDTSCTPDVCYQTLISYTCKPGYYPKDNECKLCTVGYYCNGSGQPEQCPEIKSGSGEYGTSKEGSKSKGDCYVPNNPKPLTATDDTGTYVCISDAPYQTGTN